MPEHDGIAFDAVTLDVGGVFVVPHHATIAGALAGADVVVDPSTFWDAHYGAMHGVDRAQSPAETFDDYVPAFCHHLGLVDGAHARAVDALDAVFGPSSLWHEPIPDSIGGIRALHEAGIPLAVVSNADGTVDRILRDTGVCQTGPGPLVPVACIVDSGALGIAKPDPATFAPALAALGTDPGRTLHVGDSVHYDVHGALAAGMQAVHFDPRGLCRSDEHRHLARLHELLG